MEKSMWMNLAIMTILSFLSMYLLMYIMVDKLEDVHFSVNQAYMAGSMTAAMVAIELIVMGKMYKNASVKYSLVGISILALVLCVAFTRYQTAIGNKDFLRSMIPHHSGAILMCQNENLTDADIRSLCSSIIESQQSEINIMKAKLAEIR
jgi:uncharacterized protein (DUF305 family)